MTSGEYTELDIQAAWTILTETKFSNSQINKVDIMEAIKHESSSRVFQLRKRLGYKMRYALAIGFLCIVIAFVKRDDTGDFIFISSLSVSYFLLVIYMYYNIRKISKERMSENLVESMRSNIAFIKATMLGERVWGIIAMPAIIIYFTVRRVLVMDSREDLAIYIGVLFVGCLVLWIWAEWSNKKKFGTLIKKLEMDLVRLETLT